MTPAALDAPLTTLSGVGPRTAATLQDALGLATVRDLLEHYPRRYQDLGSLTVLDEVEVGEPATLIGTVRSWRRFSPRRGRRRLEISEAQVEAAGGGVFRATFFNQPFRERMLPAGTRATFSGTIETYRGALQIAMPETQRIGPGGDLDHQRLLPVYPATDAVPSWRIARLVGDALASLPSLPDHLPAWLRTDERLVDLDTALRTVHAPPDWADAERARRRLAFDELFTLQLGLQWRRRRLEQRLVGLDNRPRSDGAAAGFLATLPFEPTGAQTRAFASIGEDLAAPRPMHRLLQGDVGAGKTLVAVWAMLCAVDNGRQAALMAPTEVLADQHHRTLVEQLAPLGVNVLDGVRIEALTSSTPTSARRRILAELLEGRIDAIVGTHALLEEGVRFADLGLVVIDEQHRFGVAQRVRLKEKAAGSLERDRTPDVLVMTATPIPRSLALTLYGDLDVTVLDESPPGRTPIVTQLLTPDRPERRARLYDFVRSQAADGLQTYVVCPLVEPSDEVDAASAESMAVRLRDEVFPDLRVGLVHGRMRPDDKDAAMGAFRRGETDVLVATTVIEVGVDNPDATVMAIENAERFGISQLHQLRGRVGRGVHKSYCVLFAGRPLHELTDGAAERLQAVAATTDGFDLAERDLELRGEGQLFGQRQSGLPDLKIARLQRDTALVGRTRELARGLLDRADTLDTPETAPLRDELFRRFAGGLEEFDALETG